MDGMGKSGVSGTVWRYGIVESKGGKENSRELGGRAEFSPMVAPELTGGTWLGYGVNEYDSPLLLCLL